MSSSADFPPDARWPAGDERNPFLRYRTLLSAYDRAVDDSELVDVVERLDDAVAGVDGRGFVRHSVRPPNDVLGVWVKDETGNVGGLAQGTPPHGHRDLARGRRDRRGRARSPSPSCGNAALAAAVIAQRVDRPLARVRADLGR